MNYIDLLNYLTDVQKIEKEDLAELIGIPQKKMDSVLCGAVSFKKKWLKNLSLYTGIPKEAILAGNFVLNYPAEENEGFSKEGEASAIPEIAPEPEESIKQYNYEKFMAFCEVRYKKTNSDVKQGFAVEIAFCTLNLLFSLVVTAFIFAQSPLTNLWLFPLICFIPTILALAATVGIHKVAKGGFKSEEKNFKIYSVFSVLPLLLLSVAGTIFKITPVWAIGIAVASILPIVYYVFIKGVTEKASNKIFVLSEVFSYLCSCLLPLSVFAGEFINKDKEALMIGAVLCAFVFSWFVSAIVLFYNNFCFFHYKKIINISRFFQPLSQKELFKKYHIRNKLIAIVLSVAIIFSGTYLFSCAMMYLTVKSVIEYEGSEAYGGFEVPEYSNFDKQNITFTQEDEVITLDYEYFTVKIPADLKKNEKITTQDAYSSDPAGGIVMIYTEENLYGSLNEIYDGNDMSDLDESQKKAMAELKQEIIDAYGFFPQSAYQLKSIIRDVRENGVSFFERKKAAAVVPFVIFDTTLSYDDEVIFYQDEAKELVLSIRRTDFSESNSTLFSCEVHGNKKSNYESFVDMRIMIRSEYADEEVAYKIVNSIEMK